MITALFMGWTDPITQSWFPIRKMSLTAAGYHTCYVNGVFQAIDVSPNMRLLFEKGLIKPDEVKISQKIPSLFAQRMPIDRPEDAIKELEFFDLKRPVDPIVFGARSGGYSITDGYDLFPEVTADPTGDYHFYFLARNLTKSETSIHKYIDTLSVGMVLDFDWNGYLTHGNTVLGKLPGYLVDMVRCNLPIDVEVAKINSKVGCNYYHLLCHATVRLKPFTETKYQRDLETVLAT